MEISSRMFIHENVLIDPFMADLKTVVHLEPIRYLLWAPFLTDQRFDQDPGGRFDAIPCFLAFVQSKLMSLLGSITFLSTIASHFSADSGFVNTDYSSYLDLQMSHFQEGVPKGTQRVNLISLFLGKLRVGSHTVPVLYRCQCSFDFGRSKKYRCYCSLPLIPTFKVALTS